MKFQDYLECYLHALSGENRAALRGQWDQAATWQLVQATYARLMRESLVAVA
jgi:hypothetical protein